MAFSRGDRPVGEWLEALRCLGSPSHASYRCGKAKVEQIWSLVESPSATPTARCGAAVALRGHFDKTGHERIRSAARSAVAPGLRAALEAAASASDADLARSMAKVDDRGITPLYPE
jgi:hypothetical protein